MNTQFENVLNGSEGALRELQPGELADVNGGQVWFGSVVVVEQPLALQSAGRCPTNVPPSVALLFPF
jgi:hypothetical protein